MQSLKEYSIRRISYNELEVYTLKMVEAFSCKGLYKDCLKHNVVSFEKGNIFLGAWLQDKKNLVGGISFESKPLFEKKIYIENLFVVREYRHNSLATNLLDYISLNKEILFEDNDLYLHLFCEKSLKKFYEKNKFNIVNQYEENSIKILEMIHKM